jgi:hypothetical protein
MGEATDMADALEMAAAAKKADALQMGPFSHTVYSE